MRPVPVRQEVKLLRKWPFDPNYGVVRGLKYSTCFDAKAVGESHRQSTRSVPAAA